MKSFLLILSLLFISCSTNIEKQTISDCGKKEIGKGLYLKKIMVGSDHVYILVNEQDRLINGNTATSYTVYSQNGKTTTSHTESNSFINQ